MAKAFRPAPKSARSTSRPALPCALAPAQRKPAPLPPNSSSRTDGLSNGKPAEPPLLGASPRAGRFARWFSPTIDRF